VGGLASSFVLELLVYPPLYFLWKRRRILSTEIEPAALSLEPEDKR
jgi:Cu(I)/Ag(I) efflux system membrane protein CusA/SilA